jgi:sugar phosphate permease
MIKKWKHYKWLVVALLSVVALLNYLDRQMFSTMQESIKADIVELQSATNFGHLMGIFLWIYGFMSPVSGIIADKFNRKWIITGSLFVWSAATYGMGLANTFDEIYWLRALMGLSEALYIPAALSLWIHLSYIFIGIVVRKWPIFLKNSKLPD